MAKFSTCFGADFAIAAFTGASMQSWGTRADYSSHASEGEKEE
jgi:hypothetical protein